MPVNFETSSWWEPLVKAGFDAGKPAVVACTGVTLYLTTDAIVATLKDIAMLAPGSTLAVTFYLPIHLLAEEDKPIQEMGLEGARKAGTPMISFFTPDEVLTLANKAGFKRSEIVSTTDIEQLYFTNRTDHLLPASGEMFLLATT